ncbi:zinc finger protein, putative [Bodo saltans]|uniref:Zinc finger protein, putative n=1 Tax=Bodo saltans TaxID=75058 RepID=A0A0S4JVS9_BODSA|nr:zinc finger protein, putative [Bodo saltans]|eukprot:CUG94409.1 zinc finger protein, putative [Bodo saltans]
MSRRLACSSGAALFAACHAPGTPSSVPPSLTSSCSLVTGKVGQLLAAGGFLNTRVVLQKAAGLPRGGGSASSSPLASSTSSTSSAAPSNFNFSVPLLSLAPPPAFTHEHLAYAHCPICRQYLHVCDMYLHLTSKHKELNPKHCQKMCNERLELYQRKIGTPLTKDTSLSSTSTLFGGAATPGGTIDTTNKKVMHDFLPTILDGGGYICNWCERRDIIHATRDQFLRHVVKDHPELDVDEIEEKIPRNGGGAVKKSVAGAPGGYSAAAVTPSAATPRRRLANVIQGIAETVVSAPPVPFTTASIPSAPPAPSSASTTTAPPPDFTCELCAKPYPNELFLLQHFESAHPYGELISSSSTTVSFSEHDGRPSLTSSGGGGARKLVENISDISRAQQLDAVMGVVAGNKGGFIADCDLCAPKLMRFTLPSALYAHLKIKHPTVDAEAELKRLSKKDVKSFPCPVCKKVFGSAEAMKAHHGEKHGVQATSTSNSTGGVSTAASTLLNAGALANPYWCHTCEKGFTTGKALLGHLTTKHGMSSDVHPCPACKRVFSDAYSLIEHVSLVHKSLSSKSIVAPEYACSECERVFLNTADRVKHTSKHHPNAVAKDSGVSLIPSVPRRVKSTTLEPPMADSDQNAAATATTTNTGPRKASSSRRVTVANSNAETTSIRSEDIEIV